MNVPCDRGGHSVHAINNGASSCTKLCLDLLASVAELIKMESILDGDMDTGAIESALYAVRVVRLGCDEIAWNLQQACPAAGLMDDSACKALQEYFSLAATDEFEFPEVRAARHTCCHAVQVGSFNYAPASLPGQADEQVR